MDKQRLNGINFDLNPNNTFFTSDTHFGHKNILRLCNRPFENVEEMNNALIENWNNVVNDNSIIFHLGDVAFGGSKLWEDTVGKLKGHKVLIVGNHDFGNWRDKYNSYFDEIILQKEIILENRSIILNHYPFLTYGGVWRDPENQVWQFHGHCHLGPTSKGSDVGQCQYRFPTQIDVGVDNFNYTPVSWKALKDIIEKQCENY